MAYSSQEEWNSARRAAQAAYSKNPTAANRKKLDAIRSQKVTGTTAGTGGGTGGGLTNGSRDKAIGDLVGKYGEGAAGLADEFFSPGSLGRVDETRSDEISGLLDQFSAIRDTYAIPGKNRSAELLANMQSQKSQAEGYNSGEYQDFREQQRRGTESAYRTQDNATNRSIVRNRLSGGQAALLKNQVQRQRADEQARNEQDLRIKSSDVKYDRTRDYGNLVRDVEDTEFGRMNDTAQQYGNALSGVRDDELKRRLINLNQVGAERAGQSGTYFGALDLGETRDTNKRNEKLSRDIYGLTKPKKRQGGGNGKGDGRSRQTTQGAPSSAFDYNAYIDRQKDIISGNY